MAEVFFKKAIEKALEECIALTFDDVRLQPGYSEVMPSQVNVESRFSRNVPLGIPIASAAMNTVTECELAIELSMLGGIGIIHRKLTPKKQARQVARVKYHLNAYIENPKCVLEDETVKAVLSRKEKKGYKRFSTFPVLDKKGKLVGIVTANDFDFCNDNSKLIKDIMTAEPLHIIGDITIEEAWQRMIQNKKKALPVTDRKGNVLGMYIFSDVKRVLGGNVEGYNVDEKGRLIVGAAIGTGKEAYYRLEKLIEENVDVVVIDTAHGDSKPVYDTLKKIKKLYPNLDVVAGNVSMGESAKRLLDAGADAIKVGQGPGSICTTRVIAGIGRPQVTAIYDCAKAVGNDGIIIADGGLSESGDLTIAIAAGAHCVMLGSMLAGTDEAPGDLIFLDGKSWKDYKGMGSLGVMQESASARQRYRQEKTDTSKLVPEGVEGMVPYKGPLEKVIDQYIGGLKAGMGYVGARNIQELREKGNFDRITNSGIRESHPHNIKITKEAPNYNPRS